MASLRFRCRQVYWKWIAPDRIRKYMTGNQVRKLQIGSGSNLLPGWLNTTLYPFAPGTVYLNACTLFPVPDDSFDYVFSEHLIEHLEFEEAAQMLRESHRVFARRRSDSNRDSQSGTDHRLVHAAKVRSATGIHPMDHGQLPTTDRRIQPSAGH